MRILLISLLLLTLVGCTYSNSNVAWHGPALYYDDSKAVADLNLQHYLVDLNRQQYLADQNRPYQSTPYSYSLTYSILDW